MMRVSGVKSGSTGIHWDPGEPQPAVEMSGPVWAFEAVSNLR